MKFDIENLTLKEIREINSLFNKDSKNNDNSIWQIGKSYFIRTVTMHLTGKLEKITPKEMVLSNASWIADSGRFHDALKNGELNEVEPFVSDVILNRESIVDATEWIHKLPKNQK